MIKRFIKKIIRFIGLFDFFSNLRQILNKNSRLGLLDDKKYFEVWSKKSLNNGNVFIKKYKKRVLCHTFGDSLCFPYELVIAKAFFESGYTPVILGARNKYVKNLWRASGITEIIDFDYIGLNHNLVELPDIDISDLEKVLSFKVDGVRIGKIALSVLLRQTRLGSPDISKNEIQKKLISILRESFNSFRIAKAIFKNVKPDSLFTCDRGYSPRGQFFEYAVNNNIPIFTMDASHKNGQLVMKRYSYANMDCHHSSLSEDSWQKIKNLEWNQKKNEEVLNEIYQSYHSGEWYGVIGTQRNKEFKDAGSLKKELKLSKTKKTAIILPHIFWDATFFWGEDLFADYEQWFVETVRNAVENDRLNWIIKIHPGNQMKDKRDGYSGEHSDIISIRKHFGELPAHIKVLPADSKISTISLYEIADYCLTVRGTPGIEGACLGVTVLTAGTGRYDGKGFTNDSKSAEEYLEKVRNLDRIQSVTEEEIELARRFAYGVFLCRPIPLNSVKLEYQQDENASLDTDLLFQNEEELRQGEDVQFLKKWIESGDEDFLYEPNLR